MTDVDDLRQQIAGKAAQCKSCGRKVLFVADDGGKNQVLDLVAPVYAVCDQSGTLMAGRAAVTYVSHFATCPQATQHSKTSAETSTAAPGASRYELDDADVKALCEIEEGLSEWEVGFVESVHEWVVDKKRCLSDKQRARVQKILEEHGR